VVEVVSDPAMKGGLAFNPPEHAVECQDCEPCRGQTR
jgi:hypothetical protein